MIGNKFSGPILPLDPNDPTPTHLSQFGKGGLRSVDTIVERDAISPNLREQGMIVVVANQSTSGGQGKNYQLTISNWYQLDDNQKALALADNNNWEELSIDTILLQSQIDDLNSTSSQLTSQINLLQGTDGFLKYYIDQEISRLDGTDSYLLSLILSSTSGGGGSVDSVNGQTGIVNLITSDITEGTNFYFTDLRAINALSTITNSLEGTDGYLNYLINQQVSRLDGSDGNLQNQINSINTDLTNLHSTDGLLQYEINNISNSILNLNSTDGYLKYYIDQEINRLSGTDGYIIDIISSSTSGGSVSSVNGQIGIVNLTTSNISEGTNFYFTDLRAQNALTLTISRLDGSDGNLQNQINSLQGTDGFQQFQINSNTSNINSLYSTAGLLQYEINSSITSLNGTDGYLKYYIDQQVSRLDGTDGFQQFQINSLQGTDGFLKYYIDQKVNTLNGTDGYQQFQINSINNSITSLQGTDGYLNYLINQQISRLDGSDGNLQNQINSNNNNISSLQGTDGFLKYYIDQKVSTLQGTDGFQQFQINSNTSNINSLYSTAGLLQYEINSINTDLTNLHSTDGFLKYYIDQKVSTLNGTDGYLNYLINQQVSRLDGSDGNLQNQINLLQGTDGYQQFQINSNTSNITSLYSTAGLLQYEINSINNSIISLQGTDGYLNYLINQQVSRLDGSDGNLQNQINSINTDLTNLHSTDGYLKYYIDQKVSTLNGTDGYQQFQINSLYSTAGLLQYEINSINNSITSLQGTDGYLNYLINQQVSRLDGTDGFQQFQINSNTSNITSLYSTAGLLQYEINNNDSLAVHLAGTEIITGKKTFNNDLYQGTNGTAFFGSKLFISDNNTYKNALASTTGNTLTIGNDFTSLITPSTLTVTQPTSLTNNFLVLSGSGANAIDTKFRVTTNGNFGIQMGSGSQVFSIGFNGGFRMGNLSSDTAVTNGITLDVTAPVTGNDLLTINGTSFAPTSGNSSALRINKTFNPTGGNANYTYLSLSGSVINQSSTAGGIITLYDTNISQTSVTGSIYGFRGRINNINNGTSWNIFADGTAPNYFQGDIIQGTSGTAAFGAVIKIFDNFSATYKNVFDVTALNNLRIGGGFNGGLTFTAPTWSLPAALNFSLGSNMTVTGQAATVNTLILSKTGSMTATSANTNYTIINSAPTFAATATSSGNFHMIEMTPTISQAGNAFGDIIIYNANPTVTGLNGALYGYRSQIPLASTSGTSWNIYADGSAPNYFRGDILQGSNGTAAFGPNLFITDNNTYRTALDVSSTNTLRIGNGFSNGILLGNDLLLTSSKGIKDSNGNYLIQFPATVSSAVNYFTLSNSATLNDISFGVASGSSDTNVNIQYNTKGSGISKFNSGIFVGSTGTIPSGIFSEFISSQAVVNTFTLTSGATTSGQNTISYSSNTTVKVGDTITGTGIAGVVYIIYIISSTSAALSATANASNTGLTFTITPSTYGTYFNYSPVNTTGTPASGLVVNFSPTTTSTITRALSIIDNGVNSGLTDIAAEIISPLKAIKLRLTGTNSTVTTTLDFRNASNTSTWNMLVQGITVMTMSTTLMTLPSGINLQGGDTSTTFSIQSSGAGSTVANFKQFAFRKGSTGFAPITGTRGYFMTIADDATSTFNPASGAAGFTTLSIQQTINQTATASGEIRLYEAIPVMTSVNGRLSGYYSNIASTAGSGSGAIYANYHEGSAPSFFAGDIQQGTNGTAAFGPNLFITDNNIYKNALASTTGNVLTLGSGFNFNSIGNGSAIAQLNNYYNKTGNSTTLSLTGASTIINTNTISYASNTILKVGDGITGTGIVANSFIIETLSSTSGLINTLASATNNALTLTGRPSDFANYTQFNFTNSAANNTAFGQFIDYVPNSTSITAGRALVAQIRGTFTGGFGAGSQPAAEFIGSGGILFLTSRDATTLPTWQLGVGAGNGLSQGVFGIGAKGLTPLFQLVQSASTNISLRLSGSVGNTISSNVASIPLNVQGGNSGAANTNYTAVVISNVTSAGGNITATSGIINQLAVNGQSAQTLASTAGNLEFNHYVANWTYNFTTNVSGAKARGFYYNPTLTSVTGVTNIAFEAASGDIYLDAGNMRFGSTSGIQDINGNYIVQFPSTITNSVNYFNISGSTSGNSISFGVATGSSDTNVAISLSGKGNKGISISGFSDASLASSGIVGEVISGSTSGYTNYISTATYQVAAQITLTAGDWDVSAFGTFSSNTATITAASNAIFTISTTPSSAAGSTEGINISYIPQATLLGTSKESLCITSYQVSISATTTYYLNTQSTFTLGNPQYVASIRARRKR